MAHLVKTKNGKHTYLALQESIYKDGKRSTKYVQYLGRADSYTLDELNKIVEDYNDKRHKR